MSGTALDMGATGHVHHLVEVPPRLVGKIRWPTIRFAEPALPAARKVETAAIRHHFVYTAGANYQNFAFAAGKFKVDKDHRGSAFPDVRIFAFPKPAGFNAADWDALEAAIGTASRNKKLVTTQADIGGAFDLGPLPYGEIIICAERPFRIVKKGYEDRRGIPFAEADVPLYLEAKVETLYRVDRRDQLGPPPPFGRPPMGNYDDNQPVVTIGGRVEIDGKAFSGDPYQGVLYVVPFMDTQNEPALNRALDRLSVTFGIPAAQRNDLRDIVTRHRIIDAEGIFWAEHIGDRRVERWAKATLFRHPNGDWGYLGDQLIYGYRPAESGSELRPLLPYIPLDDEFFRECHALAHPAATRHRHLWGRHPLRRMTAGAAMSGGDVNELKTRIILWGNNAQFVDLRNNDLDEATQRALVRFKHRAGLHLARQTISAVIDRSTYQALDAATPPITLDQVSSYNDPATPNARDAFPEHGFDRLVHYGILNAAQRLQSPNARPITINSAFRTIVHNRRVYLTTMIDADNDPVTPNVNDLRWRFATANANGIAGRDGSAHAAMQHVTAADMVWDAVRGTYRGVSAPIAADFSNHIDGEAVDFHLRPAGVTIGQVHTDHDSMGQMGATIAQNAGAAGRLWLEPQDNRRRIHLDSGPNIALDDRQYVLTLAARNGPRWDATVVLFGNVQNADGTVAPYVPLELVAPGNVALVEFHSDRLGNYYITAAATAFPGPYFVVAKLDAWSELRVANGGAGVGQAGATDAVSRVRVDPAPRTARYEVRVPTPGVATRFDLVLPA